MRATVMRDSKLVEAAREANVPFTMGPARDVVMGHEFCAEVVDFGPETQRAIKPGKKPQQTSMKSPAVA